MTKSGHGWHRRETLALLAAALVLPRLARAQQTRRVRRIAVLMPTAENDPETDDLGAAFRAALRQQGWTGGRNLHVDYRWGAGDESRIRAYAAQLVALQPEAILAGGAPAVAPLLAATKSIPIVFVSASDPVTQGFVKDMAHPGGNATGFTNIAPSMARQWVALLREIAPNLKRAALLYNPRTAPYTDAFLREAQAAAAATGLTVESAPVSDDDAIAARLAGLGAAGNAGLLVPSDAFTYTHYGIIVALAAQHRLPAIYPFRIFPLSGGLVSYGIDLAAEMRQAAVYIDRILSGTAPGDLPVQAPGRYQLVVNRRAAAAAGLTLPQSLLARADEIIQ